MTSFFTPILFLQNCSKLWSTGNRIETISSINRKWDVESCSKNKWIAKSAKLTPSYIIRSTHCSEPKNTFPFRWEGVIWTVETSRSEEIDEVLFSAPKKLTTANSGAQLNSVWRNSDQLNWTVHFFPEQKQPTNPEVYQLPSQAVDKESLQLRTCLEPAVDDIYELCLFNNAQWHTSIFSLENNFEFDGSDQQNNNLSSDRHGRNKCSSRLREWKWRTKITEVNR